LAQLKDVELEAQRRAVLERQELRREREQETRAQAMLLQKERR